MYQLLCIEDSEEVQLVLDRTLGRHHHVLKALNLRIARSILSTQAIDMILLDIALPDGDGLRFCSELKSNPETKEIPVIILTSKTNLEEKTLGFQLGIEDYIEKPFNPAELRLRVDARLQKMKSISKSYTEIQAGTLRIDLSAQRAHCKMGEGVEQIELSSTEFKILSYLAQKIDQVKTREQIISAVWKDGFHLSDRTIDSHISRIRKKICQSNCAIEAVPNTGYRLSIQSQSKKVA